MIDTIGYYSAAILMFLTVVAAAGCLIFVLWDLWKHGVDGRS